MRARTTPSMAMIAIAFLLASALALALTMVGSAQERGISSVRAADAAARVGVTAKCDGNPEKVIVKNNTRHRIKIKKVGSIYRPYDYEPKTFNKILRRGRTATFEAPCFGNATATVVDEGRAIPITNGQWSDTFADGNAVHLYRIDGGGTCGL